MGSDISTEEECTFNNTYHVQSVEAALSAGVIFSDFEKICTVVALPIILSVGLLGNVAFLYTVARVHRMRTATNFYLSNLAVADLMFLSLAMSARLRAYVVYGIPNEAPLWGQIGCVLGVFAKYSFNFAGMILITFISLERYIAVCHPLRHRLISGRSRSIKLIVVCWILALILAPLVIPSNFEFVQYCLSWATDDPDLQNNFPRIVGRCHSLEGTWANQMIHLTQTVPFFVAFFGNAYFYTRILIKLHKRDTAYDRQQIIRTRNQVAIMLVVNGTVFFLTLTAFEVTSVILFVEGFLDIILVPYEIRDTLFEINRILVYINSAVNPIVYTLTNARYRRAFRRAFAARNCKGERSRNSTVSSVATAHNLYTFTGHFPSVNPPSAPVGRSAQGRGTYFNVCFDNGEETVANVEPNGKATTEFPTEN